LVVRVYLWTGLAASAAGIAMLVARRPLLLWVLNHGRAAGFFVTANQFAAFLIMFVFIALGTALATRNAALRILASVALAVSGAALALTFSAAGWLGVVVAGLFFSYAMGARRVALGILAAGILCMAFFAISPSAGHHNPAEATSRLRAWSAGVRVAQLFPLTGAGPMTYWRVYPAVRAPNGDPPGSFGALHPHDVFISLAAETGALGILATLLGWYWYARAVRRDLAGATPAGRRFALGVCAGFVAVFVQGAFDTVGVVALTFVWIPFTALGLAAARYGLGEA
jgi:O-antigen ligase